MNKVIESILAGTNKIKVYESSQYKFEEIEYCDIGGHSSYVEICNVYVEITNTELIVYSKKKSLHNHFSWIKFKERNRSDDFISSIRLSNSLLLNTQFRNVYYHWIFDILPQLKVTLSFSDISILSLPFIFPYQSESLSFYANNSNVHKNLGFYYIDSLIIPNPTTNNLIPSDYALDFLRTKSNNKEVSNKMIYITRKKGLKRRIINENELISFLKKLGVQAIILEDLSFFNQKKIFETSCLIISAHGSGLSNIVFCKEETTILEIYGPGCGERCFAKISKKLNLNYFAMQIKKLSYENSFDRILSILFPNLNKYHFKLDLEDFKKFLFDNITMSRKI